MTPFLEYYRGKQSELHKVLTSIDSEFLEVGLRSLLASIPHVILAENCGPECHLFRHETGTYRKCLTHVDANVCSIDFICILFCFIMIHYLSFVLDNLCINS